MSDIWHMQWILGALAICLLLFARRHYSRKMRVCRSVLAARAALERHDFTAFAQHLDRSRQLVEGLQDVPLRLEFQADLALMAAQGAYWEGDLAASESAARQAIETLHSGGEGDAKGRLCMAHSFLGDIHLDNCQPSHAAEEFRAAASIAESGKAPVLAIFPLQRLADVLWEEQQRADAAAVIERCVEIEREFFASNPPDPSEGPMISMTAPDQSLVRGDYATAERLFEEKVRWLEGPGGDTPSLDILRYQLHLAEAQQQQGHLDDAKTTLQAASECAEKRFGPQHPRVLRLRRKLAAIAE
jgi:hypothetical protein